MVYEKLKNNKPFLFQVVFAAGSLVCAVAGMSLHFLQSRLRSDKRFGQLHHFGTVGVAMLSLLIFQLDFATLLSVPALVPALLALAGLPVISGRG